MTFGTPGIFQAIAALCFYLLLGYTPTCQLGLRPVDSTNARFFHYKLTDCITYFAENKILKCLVLYI